MTLQIERKSFRDAIAIAARIVGKKSKRNNYVKVSLRFADGKLHIVCSNIVNGGRTSYTTSVAACGTLDLPDNCIVVDAHLLLKTLSGRNTLVKLSYECNASGMHILNVVNRALTRLALSEFVPLANPAVQSQETVALSANTLRTALQKCTAHVSSEESRYYLNGVYIHIRDRKLAFAATDRHTLAATSVECEKTDFPDVIVPSETIKILLEALKPFQNDVVGATIAVQNLSGFNKRVVFKVDNNDIAQFEITSGVIDGSFPDYLRILPQGNCRRLTLDRAELLSLVSNAIPLCGGRRKGIDGIVVLHAEQDAKLLNVDCIEWQQDLFDKERKKLKTEDAKALADLEALCCAVRCTSTLELQNIDCDTPFCIALALIYVERTLKSMTGSVTICIKNALSPVKSVDNDNPNDDYLIMPRGGMNWEQIVRKKRDA